MQKKLEEQSKPFLEWREYVELAVSIGILYYQLNYEAIFEYVKAEKTKSKISQLYCTTQDLSCGTTCPNSETWL